jgi:hypothetical protein
MIMKTNLLRMLCVVQTQAPHSPDVLRSQGREERADIGNLVSHFVLPEDVTGDDPGLFCLANIRDARGKDGITVVDAAILC